LCDEFIRRQYAENGAGAAPPVPADPEAKSQT
jgi:hypothetical protein